MNVALWTPAHSHMRYETARGVINTIDLFGRLGIPVSHQVLAHESLLSRARNTIAAEFLRSFADILISIDADIVFEAQDVLNLLKRERAFCAAAVATSERSWPRDSNRPLTVQEDAPLAFCAIHRSAFLAMVRAREADDAYPLQYYPSFGHACVWGFYIPFVHERRYLSDVEAFSHRLRRAGVDPCVDRSIRVGHVETVVRSDP